jgi:hypothetical protein
MDEKEKIGLLKNLQKFLYGISFIIGISIKEQYENLERGLSS